MTAFVKGKRVPSYLSTCENMRTSRDEYYVKRVRQWNFAVYFDCNETQNQMRQFGRSEPMSITFRIKFNEKRIITEILEYPYDNPSVGHKKDIVTLLD